MSQCHAGTRMKVHSLRFFFFFFFLRVVMVKIVIVLFVLLETHSHDSPLAVHGPHRQVEFAQAP